MRTKNQVFALTGHMSTVPAIACQPNDPQVITGSADSTIKLWDLAAGKTITTLTQHKKGIRSFALNPTENSFISGATDNIKQWMNPHGNFVQNFQGHNTIINALSCNQDNVLFSGGL
jgi:pleiotropic regulator 1